MDPKSRVIKELHCIYYWPYLDDKPMMKVIFAIWAYGFCEILSYIITKEEGVDPNKLH